jgi:hypothetical protein
LLLRLVNRNVPLGRQQRERQSPPLPRCQLQALSLPRQPGLGGLLRRRRLPRAARGLPRVATHAPHQLLLLSELLHRGLWQRRLWHRWPGRKFGRRLRLWFGLRWWWRRPLLHWLLRLWLLLLLRLLLLLLLMMMMMMMMMLLLMMMLLGRLWLGRRWRLLLLLLPPLLLLLVRRRLGRGRRLGRRCSGKRAQHLILWACRRRLGRGRRPCGRLLGYRMGRQHHLGRRHRLCGHRLGRRHRNGLLLLPL